MLRPLVLVAPVIVLVLSAAQARAQSASSAATGAATGDATLGYPGAQPAGALEDPGAYTHDGFYLRLALGGGYVHDKLHYEGVPVFGLKVGSFDGQANGGSFQGDLAGGWAIEPGLIIGGELYIEQVANPTVTVAGRNVGTDVSVGTLTMLGPYIDWYLDPHKGFHFGGMIGGARLTMKDSADNKLSNDPIGGGGMAFVGYEWWAAEQWAVGVQGQFAVASMNDSSANTRHTWISGGLVFSVTYN